MRRTLTRAAATLVAAAVSVTALAAAGMALGQTSTPKNARRSLTLKVAKNVHNTNAKFAQFAVKKVDTHEPVVVGPLGFAVYTFQGETTRHIICKVSRNPASNCWAFWPPVSVNSTSGLSEQTGIRGKLGAFRNHGMLQLTLDGRPLYYFTPDIESHNKGVATSDETKTFGSIWHIVGGAAASRRTPTGATPTSTMPGSTTPTVSNPYPGH